MYQNIRLMNPLVTVYVPTFNRVEMLGRALESVLSQTYENLEIIVVDDGSDDDTRGYLTKISRTDSRVKYIRNSSNLGACGSRNKAIEIASGEFITGLDDDDYFLPHRINGFLEAWQVKKPGVVALFTSVKKKVGENDNDIVVDKKIPFVRQDDLLYSNYVGNQLFTRTEILKKIHGFDAAFPAWQDLDCWYRLLADDPAQRVDNYSYVVDVSHSYDRISKSIQSKVNTSYIKFRKKHNLSYRMAVRLMCQKTAYSPSLLTYLNDVLLSLLILDSRLLRLSLVRARRFLRGRIKT